MALRILIVDDEPAIRFLFTDVFTESGWEVDEAPTAELALEQIAAQRPDALLVDKNLPGTSGIQLVQQVRRDDERTVCAIITAYGTVSSALEALDLGVDAYIEKPIPDPFWMVIRIHALVRWRAQRAAMAARVHGTVVRAAVVALTEADGEIVASWLRRAGVGVEVCTDTSATTQARVVESRPDLLVLDHDVGTRAPAFLGELRISGISPACVMLAPKSLPLHAAVELFDLHLEAVLEKPLSVTDLELRLA